MITFIQSLILIISVTGLFLIFFLLTDKDIENLKNSNEKILEIYTYNIEEKDINELIKILEKSKKLEQIVDVINIHEKFDKK